MSSTLHLPAPSRTPHVARASDPRLGAPRGWRPALTLVETSFVLLVIVVVLGGALALAALTMRQSTVASETQTLVSLSGSVVKVKGNGGYNTDSTLIMRALDTMELIPSNVSKSGSGATTELTNGWGGAITIAATNGGANFSITYEQIPRADCTQLVMGVKPSILQSVGSGGSSTTNIVDVDADAAATMCAGGTNTITWSSEFL